MWQVRTQFSKPNSENPTGPLEWNAVFADTEEAAETWWNARTTMKTTGRRVCTMFDPEGNLVKVLFK